MASTSQVTSARSGFSPVARNPPYIPAALNPFAAVTPPGISFQGPSGRKMGATGMQLDASFKVEEAQNILKPLSVKANELKACIFFFLELRSSGILTETR
uniref:Arginine biosynthesis bifunctional protein ArgJic isoform X2 n=1 Tax=Rhizophora mucronata TaxID=61149 RepID=A0A2P2KFP8_RHIMU